MIASGIQQENRHIRQLQHENKELRAALEEHQNAIELIMSKYREHMACLLNSTKVDKNFMNQQKTVVSATSSKILVTLFLLSKHAQGLFDL